MSWSGISMVGAGLPIIVLVMVQSSAPRAAEGDIRLLQAAKKDDVAAVRSVLTAEAEVNSKDVDGSTPVLWATYHSNLDIVRELIAAGADVNIANRYGVTPLLQASRLGNFPIIHVLVNAGADINAAQPEGETPLMAAAAAGAVDAVKVFIARGADVNTKERAQDQTALMWASGEGHLAVIDALLEAGADPNAVGRVTSLLRIKGDAGRMWVDHSSGGLTALMFAARQGHVNVAKRLIEADADVNRSNPDGLTPLVIAVINDHLDVAGVLLEQGANPNDGSLYEAVQLHNLRTNETIGEATRPRPKHQNTLTPLDLIARMLDCGGDPTRLAKHTLHTDSTGQPQPANQSAFGRALAAQDVGALRIMLAKGVDVNLAQDAGTPLMMLMAGNRFGGGFGAQPGAFRFAGSRSITDAATLLFDAGADVNRTGGTGGETPLHVAARTGNVAMIQWLADRGATLDVPNAAGFTPLGVAMGKQAAAGPGAGGGDGGPGPRRGGPQPQAIMLLRQLMGLPPLSPEEMPVAPKPGS